MSDRCKGVGQSCLQVFADSLSPNPTVSTSISLMRQTLKELLDMSEQLQAMLQAGSSESVGEMVESELAAMDKAIEEAARRIEVSSYFINLLSYCTYCRSVLVQNLKLFLRKNNTFFIL